MWIQLFVQIVTAESSFCMLFQDFFFIIQLNMVFIVLIKIGYQCHQSLLCNLNEMSIIQIQQIQIQSNTQQPQLTSQRSSFFPFKPKATKQLMVMHMDGSASHEVLSFSLMVTSSITQACVTSRSSKFTLVLTSKKELLF